jgi:periplasmic divalent cation tolerance protein
MLLKTTADRTQKLKQAILDNHPYECPEVLILSVTGGSEEYLNWITGNTK